MDWSVVYFASGMTDAEIVCGRLEAEGISTRLEYEAIGRIYALTLNGLGEVKVLVPELEKEKARQVLSVYYSDEELPWEGE